MSLRNGAPLELSGAAVAVNEREKDPPVLLVTVTVIVDVPLLANDLRRTKPFFVSLKISIDLMTTSLTGRLTSPDDWLVTFVREIPSRTASPSMSWPKIECLKSKWRVATSVTKNCESFVSAPALAYDNTPERLC